MQKAVQDYTRTLMDYIAKVIAPESIIQAARGDLYTMTPSQ